MSEAYPSQEILAGAREVIPLALGAGIYGLAFGLLSTQASMDGLQTGVMGSLVFAGAAQIVAVERFISGAGAFMAIVAGVALNLRLLLITASIRDVFADRPFWQQVLGAHLTVDENWALMLSARARGRDVGYWYLLGAGAIVITLWVGSTVAGAYFAAALPEPKAIGMDFAFVAAFIAITKSLWRGKKDFLPWVTAFSVVCICMQVINLESSWALIIGGLTGAVASGFSKNEDEIQ